MRKSISFITILVFFIWILPLGIFIKPSQEKKACNGQRAFCMCAHLLAKRMAQDAGKTMYRSGGGAEQKEHNAFGGANLYFLSMRNASAFRNHLFFYHRDQSRLYSLLVVHRIDHVPKT